MDKNIHTSLLYLWNRRTLYLGPLCEPICMKNAAASIIVALTGSIQVSCPGNRELVTCKSVLVPPGVAVKAFTGDAIIACCMLDVFGLDYAALLPQMERQCMGEISGKAISFDIKHEDTYIETLSDLYQSHYHLSVAAAKLDQLLTPPERLIGLKYGIDPRIEQVISIIKTNIEQNLSIDYLARSVNISVPHLVRLFKAQTGVPIRRFRLWHRLYVASVLMAKTGNLTTAALAAGFTDAPHFLHTFQDMLGMRPSLFLGLAGHITIFAEPEE